jgi:hypothetical protein
VQKFDCTSGIKRLDSKGNIFGGATNHWSPILCFVNFFVKIYTLFRDIKIHFPLHAMQFHQPILFTTKKDIFSIATTAPLRKISENQFAG